MGNQHVLHQRLQPGRKPIDGVHLLGDQFVLDEDVSEELAFVGVAQGALITEFPQLSHVMQDGAREQQVSVHFGVMTEHQAAQFA
jgi:hypothetical protein